MLCSWGWFWSSDLPAYICNPGITGPYPVYVLPGALWILGMSYINKIRLSFKVIWYWLKKVQIHIKILKFLTERKSETRDADNETK